MDQNGDGHITAEELRSAMRRLGEQISDEEVDQLIAAADANGDGVIDYEGELKTGTASYVTRLSW